MSEPLPRVAGRAPFLRADWRHLAMLNYEVDPAALRPLVPRGTELDTWQGTHYASVVGFLFLDTRVLGLAIPFHRDFEEVNLRFYVRRRAEEGWRRGVVFVKELVPRRAIALVARALYGENYVAVPMSHRLEPAAGDPRRVSYAWRHRGRQSGLRLETSAAPTPAAAGSEQQFIAEHYWGYTARPGGGTLEYRVEHPPWSVAAAAAASLDCDVAALYGDGFSESLAGAPLSAFLANGSAVAVYRGVRIS